MLGKKVGNYEVTAQLGMGGMGVVYLAKHSMIGRPAAIKVLRSDMSHNREVVNRFFNEARAATAIRHPGIVEIYDFGYLPDGSAYIIMELLDGESLADRILRVGRVDATYALTIARQISNALHAAHEQQIVHRDLKPENVFLVRDPENPGGERIKLLDFGIAKLAAAAGERSQTRTGEVIGTPSFMSPEQCRGAGKVDSRSDLYSLGCLLYVLLCGRPPFVAEGPGDIIAHHLYFPPDPPSRHEPSIPVGVEQLVLSLLQKEPDARPATATAVMETIDRINSAAGGGGSFSRPSTHWMFPAQVASRTPAQAAAKQSTTLSGSASQLRHPATPQTMVVRPRSRRLLYAGVGGVLLAGGFAVVMLRGRGEEAATQAPRSATAPLEAASSAPSLPPPKTDPPPEQDAPTAPLPEVIQLAIESDPSDAQVLFNNEVVGSTPYAETLPRTNEERSYTIRKDGYVEQKVAFTGTGDEFQQLKLTQKISTSPTPIPRPKPTRRPKSKGGDLKGSGGINPFEE